jgi:hypothetical protein
MTFSIISIGFEDIYRGLVQVLSSFGRQITALRKHDRHLTDMERREYLDVQRIDYLLIHLQLFGGMAYAPQSASDSCPFSRRIPPQFTHRPSGHAVHQQATAIATPNALGAIDACAFQRTLYIHTPTSARHGLFQLGSQHQIQIPTHVWPRPSRSVQPALRVHGDHQLHRIQTSSDGSRYPL